MDLIERYVAAVRRHLPRSANPDIVSELSDNLRSQAEEREQQLGRALNEDEQGALIRPHGHPWLMASRYMPQQYLIGPGLYPYYRQAMTLAVFWVVLPLTLIGGAFAAMNSDDPGRWISRMIGAAWNGSIYAVGSVTIIFAILEHERVKFTALDNWNPAKLPVPGPGRSIPRSESVANLVFTIIMLVWWTELVRLPSFTDVHDDVTMRFVAAPIWSEVYWPVVIALACGIAISLIDMAFPFRSIAVSIADIVTNVFSAGIIAMVVRSERYVEIMAEPIYADRVLQANHWINVSLYWGFVITGIIVVMEIVKELWHVSRALSNRTAVTLA